MIEFKDIDIYMFGYSYMILKKFVISIGKLDKFQEIFSVIIQNHCFLQNSSSTSEHDQSTMLDF